MLNLSNAGVALSYAYGRVLDGAWQGESPAPVASPSSKRLFIGPIGHYAPFRWGK
jgi:hypothetical protein